MPLVKVFEHPWVVNFQVKYNLEKEDFGDTRGNSERRSEASEASSV